MGKCVNAFSFIYSKHEHMHRRVYVHSLLSNDNFNLEYKTWI